MFKSQTRVLVFIIATLLAASGHAQDEASKKPVAGKADVLRNVPKKFATLIRVDDENRQVELKVEGEEQSRTWSVLSGAELKIHGWWGRLKQFKPGDRVWVWFAIDRQKQPQSVLMLADEISQQVIHGLPHTLKAFDAKEGVITVESKISGERALKVEEGDFSELIGKEAYVQSAGDSARIVVGEEQLHSMREQQKEWLRRLWREEGLPGVTTFLHPLSGEMEVMLDHEAIRWGRYLKNGDQVTLKTNTPTTAPIKANVKHVQPWRERTLVRLVTNSGVDQFDLSLGQRVMMNAPEPPKEIQALDLPTDIGRLKSKEERLQWFLASTYCSCKIAGDRCTGMFYSLASCNVNSCGMPNLIRGKVSEMIDEGLTDEQIWRKLQELRGPDVARQHLLR